MIKIFYVRIGVFFNSYKYYSTNNFKYLIDKKGLKITFIITILILTTMDMYIGPIRFLEASAPDVVFDTDRKMLKVLVIVEEICAKLIFRRWFGLN